MVVLKKSMMIPAIAALVASLSVSAETIDLGDGRELTSTVRARQFEPRSLFDGPEAASAAAGGSDADRPSVLMIRLRLWDLKLSEFEVYDSDDDIDVSLISSHPLTDSNNLVDAMHSGRAVGQPSTSQIDFAEILALSSWSLTTSN